MPNDSDPGDRLYGDIVEHMVMTRLGEQGVIGGVEDRMSVGAVFSTISWEGDVFLDKENCYEVSATVSDLAALL